MALTPKKSAVESIKLGQFVTPKGSALFVSVPEASPYDANKQEASILLKAEEWEVLKAQIEAKITENNAYTLVPEDRVEWPIKLAKDKEGNETGDIILKSKTGMQYPAKVLDVSGKNITNDTTGIPNRSVIRLALGAEIIKSMKYSGVIFRLNVIKVLQASPWADHDPFGDSDDDFVAEAVGEAEVDWTE